MREKGSAKKRSELNRKNKLHLNNIRRKGKFQSFNNVEIKEREHRINHDKKIIEHLKERYLERFSHFIVPGSGNYTIQIPENFCFCTNYSKSFETISEFASSLYDNLGQDLLIDFSLCKTVDTSALFVLQILRLEFLEVLSQLQSKLTLLNVVPELRITAPRGKDAIRLLLIAGFPVEEKDVRNLNDDSQLTPIHHMGYLKGSKSQKHYLENKKGVFAATVVRYLNDCLKMHEYELSAGSVNSIDGIVGEVLSNAEDHGGTNNWYITANFSKEVSKLGAEGVGEMNLVIMNFGSSIYEAFLDTQHENSEMFDIVKNHSDSMFQKHPSIKFNEEQIFVLSMMQEQISRLKFKEESRGTGTMKFINSFLQIGSYQDIKKNYTPNLSIFSGNVHMICDHKFKPFEKNELYYLSLNPENDLKVPPSSTHLKKLGYKFPGTLLSVKIYTNKEHWDTKYAGN